MCRCGQASISGQTRCSECAEKHREWHRQNSEKQRQAKGAQPRRWKDDAELLALTQEETAPQAKKEQKAKRTPKRVRSEAYEQKRKQRQTRVRAERKSLGLCVRCARPSLEGQTRCAGCVLKHRQEGRRSRAKAKPTAK